MAVHDRLRQPRRARREEHIQRVRERQRARTRAAPARPVARPSRPRPEGCRRRRPRRERARPSAAKAAAPGRRPPVRGGRRACRRSGSRRPPAERSGSSWPSLLITLRVPNSGGHVAQIGAEARGREEGDERLRDVREIGDDAVAGADAEPLQARARSRDLLAQVAERQLDRARGTAIGRRPRRSRVSSSRPSMCSAKLSRAPGNHSAPGMLPRPEHPLVRRVRANLEEVPERAPEAFEVADRPAMKLLVAGKVEPALGPQPDHVAPELEPLARVAWGRPQHLPHRQGLTVTLMGRPRRNPRRTSPWPLRGRGRRPRSGGSP